MKNRILAGLLALAALGSLVACNDGAENNDNIKNETNVLEIETLNIQIDFDNLPELKEDIIIEEADEIEQSDYDVADNLWYSGKSEEALSLFERFLNDFPESPLAPSAQKGIALCYRSMKKTETAIDEFLKIIENYPDSAEAKIAYYNIAYEYAFSLQNDDYAKYYYWLFINDTTKSNAKWYDTAVVKLCEYEGIPIIKNASGIDTKINTSEKSINFDELNEVLNSNITDSEFFDYVLDIYVNMEGKNLRLNAVVKDLTPLDTVVDFADTLVRQVNLLAQIQDSTISSANTESFGGLYDQYNTFVCIAPESQIDNESNWFILESMTSSRVKTFQLQKPYR